MNDSISRQAAVDLVTDMEFMNNTAKGILRDRLRKLSPAQPERKNGEWILVKGSNGKDYHKCSECLHTQDITGVKNYCAVCGADMIGDENGKNE